MQDRTDSDSRKLLKRLKEILAAAGGGQDRLDQITHHIADSMGTEVCSIYLFRDADTLELCATEGLRPEAVHQTRLRLGEGLVGRVARTGVTAQLDCRFGSRRALEHSALGSDQREDVPWRNQIACGRAFRDRSCNGSMSFLTLGIPPESSL